VRTALSDTLTFLSKKILKKELLTTSSTVLLSIFPTPKLKAFTIGSDGQYYE